METEVITIEEITPKKAAEYLKHNTDNYRKMHRDVVNAYARDMAEGRWQMTGVPIVFGVDGVLKDGQHRLGGIVKSGKTIRMAVARNIRKEVNNYDTGLKRTDVQILAAEGIDADGTIVAAANIIVNQFKYGRKDSSVQQYVKAHVDELNRAMHASCYGDGKGKNAPSVAASYLMLRTGYMSFHEVGLFFRLMNDKSYTQADGYEISPAIVAQRMFDNRGPKNAGAQVRMERLEILILAMRDFHDGKKREMNYRISEPFKFTELLHKVRKMDGLE